MKLLILGHAGHGKDTFAEMLVAELGVEFISSSRAALDAIWPVLSYVTEETDKEVAFTIRGNHRELWRRLISLYNAADRGALVRMVLAKCDCYVGMRCPLEYEATRELFDCVIYVDAHLRLGTREPSMGVVFDPADMYLVGNNGTPDELKRAASDLAYYLRTQA